MQWSFPIARVAGSEIRIHLTFFLLLAWIGIVHYRQGGAGEAWEGIAFIIAVFTCVVLHELGHAIAARRYGIRTPRITLLPIGGLAELERMPEKPGQEIVVALAGPLVNVVIAALLIAGFGADISAMAFAELESPAREFINRLAAVNIILVVFNLIPAFPMDGGRVLRALLATRFSRTRATSIAATTGQGLAFLFGFLGLIGGNPLLVFIAIFIYLAASAEARMTGLMEIGRAMTAGQAAITEFVHLGPQSNLGDAADALLRTTQHEFPVLDGSGELRGFLTRQALVAGLAADGREAAVITHMDSGIPALPAGARLSDAIAAIQSGAVPAIAITDANRRFTGYVTRENLAELMMIHSARD